MVFSSWQTHAVTMIESVTRQSEIELFQIVTR